MDAAAALGAYGVFYLRTDPALGSRLDINSVPVNVVFGAVVAGVVAWTLYTVLEPRLRERASPTAFRAVLAVVAVAMGIYTAVVLSYPEHLHLTLSPAVGLATAVVCDLGRSTSCPGSGCKRQFDAGCTGRRPYRRPRWAPGAATC